MTARKPTARKRTTARRRKAVKRTPLPKVPKGGPAGVRIGAWFALRLAREYEKHQTTVGSRKDAAILRLTHEGCPTCKGNGQIFTKGKDGSFTGSKPCPAKPTKGKASRMRVAIASRFGADKNSGLVGWTCPCGKKEKPRFRDAKEATKALRTHERQKHGGKSVGGAWYGQTATATVAAKPKAKTVSKVARNTGMTDKQWEKQNGGMTPAKAKAKGYCWQCSGKGALYSAHGGEQIITACGECEGSGRINAPYDPNDPSQEHRRGPVNPLVPNPHSGLTDAQWLEQSSDRTLVPGGCPTCRGTTYVPVLNDKATSDYERQTFKRCTGCVAGRVKA